MRDRLLATLLKIAEREGEPESRGGPTRTSRSTRTRIVHTLPPSTATSDVEVQVGSTTRRMRARRASEAEKAARWPRLVAMYRDYDDYQARTTRDIPVMILSPR